MKRTRASLLRRVVMWAAGVVLALSVAAWGVSLWGFVWKEQATSLWISRGNIEFVSNVQDTEPGWHVRGFASPLWKWPSVTEWQLNVDLGEGPVRGPVVVVTTLPLWMLAAAAVLVLAPMWFVGRKARHRRGAGLCPSCGYDWRAVPGPCPECGNERASTT